MASTKYRHDRAVGCVGMALPDTGIRPQSVHIHQSRWSRNLQICHRTNVPDMSVPARVVVAGTRSCFPAVLAIRSCRLTAARSSNEVHGCRERMRQTSLAASDGPISIPPHYSQNHAAAKFSLGTIELYSCDVVVSSQAKLDSMVHEVRATQLSLMLLGPVVDHADRVHGIFG